MSSSDSIGELVLPALRAAAAASGEVAEDGRWSPPSWAASDPAAPPPPDPDALVFARGFEAGCREGERRADQDLRPLVQALQFAAERLERLESTLARDRAHAVTMMALAVARALFQREVEFDHEVVSHLVERAVDLLPRDAPVQVRLHPLDLGLLESLGGAPSAGRTVEWVADPTLGRGDCVAEAGTRIVDGRVDMALRTWCERLTHE
jgi:flagellar biosynthesis/type III secretory pathway protein FliH